MDKQQAAEAKYPDPMSLDFFQRQKRREFQKAFIEGWEAHEAQEANCPTDEHGELNCPVLDAVYEGAAQWEDRCKSAEKALQECVKWIESQYIPGTAITSSAYFKGKAALEAIMIKDDQ